MVDAKEDSTGGQVEFRGLDFEDDEASWIDEIATNAGAILKTNSGFTVEKELGRLLGRTLGLARETHIRKALKKLKNNGVISDVPTGKLQKAYIARE